MTLRSVESLHACDTIPEPVHPQTGDVVIGDLHLPTSKSRALVEVQLVIGTILSEGNRNASIKEVEESIWEEAVLGAAGLKRTTFRGLSDRRE